MTAPIPAGMRADLDRELEQAIQGLLAKASEFDHLDLIEANVELTDLLLASLPPSALAASASALALRIHRSRSDG